MAKIFVCSLVFNNLDTFKGFAFWAVGGRSSFSVLWDLVFSAFAKISVCPSLQQVNFQLAASRAGLLPCFTSFSASSFQVCFLIPQISKGKGKGGNEYSSSYSCYNSFLCRAMNTMWFLEGFISKFWSHRGNMFLPSRHICIVINVNGSCKHWTENRAGSGRRHGTLLPTWESHNAQDLAVGTLAVFCWSVLCT